MRTKRLIAVVSLLIGMVVGVVGAPLLTATSAQAKKKTYTYWCIKPDAFTDITLNVLNTEKKKAHVQYSWAFATGSTPLEIDPLEVISPNDPGTVTWVRFVSDRKLVVDAFVFDGSVAGDTKTWQVRCT